MKTQIKNFVERSIAMILAAVILTACISILPQYKTKVYAWTFQPDITIKVDGSKLEYFNDPPIIDNGTTLVAVAYVSQALKMPICWEAETRQVYINGDDIIMKIDSKEAKINGETVVLPVAPFISNGRTYVPLRFISEYMGCTVDWVDVKRMILINRIPEGRNEAPAFERLMQTDMFYYVDSPTCEWCGLWVPNSKLTTFSDDEIAEKTKWVISIDPGEDEYNFHIGIEDYNLEARREVYTILKMLYPSGYDEVYDLMMQTLRQQLWEFRPPHWPTVSASGTFGLRYYDDREVNLCLTSDFYFLTIRIVEKGKIREVKPQDIDEEFEKYLIETGVWEAGDDFSKWFLDRYELEVYR